MKIDFFRKYKSNSEILNLNFNKTHEFFKIFFYNNNEKRLNSRQNIQYILLKFY